MANEETKKRVTFSDTPHYFNLPTENDDRNNDETEAIQMTDAVSVKVVTVDLHHSDESAETILSHGTDTMRLEIIDSSVVPPIEQPTLASEESEPKYLARLSEEEYKSAFYSPFEVHQMRIDACEQAAQYNRSVRLYVDPDRLTKAKAEARGLENSSYDRDQHRSLCIEAVVEGQKHVKRLNDNCTRPRDKLKEDEYLAKLSSNCSKWARDLAREDGNFDYEEAYGDEPWFPMKPHGTPTPLLEDRAKRGNRSKIPSYESLPPVFALEHRPYPYYNYFDAILDATKVQTPKKTSFWSKLCRRKHRSSSQV